MFAAGMSNGDTLRCYPAARTETSYTVPDGIGYMESRAFSSNPYLEEVTLPASIRSVSYGVFDGCSKLKTICYEGTKTQWMKLNVYGLDQEVVCRRSEPVHSAPASNCKLSTFLSL